MRRKSQALSVAEWPLTRHCPQQYKIDAGNDASAGECHRRDGAMHYSMRPSLDVEVGSSAAIGQNSHSYSATKQGKSRDRGTGRGIDVGYSQRCAKDRQHVAGSAIERNGPFSTGSRRLTDAQLAKLIRAGRHSQGGRRPPCNVVDSIFEQTALARREVRISRNPRCQNAQFYS